jgi:hypothetical protein
MTAFIIENSSVCTKVQSLKFVVLVAEPAGISLYSGVGTRNSVLHGCTATTILGNKNQGNSFVGGDLLRLDRDASGINCTCWLLA